MSDQPVPLHRNRDFLLLWSGSAVSALGSNATQIAYPLLVLALTGSPLDAGLAGTVALLPQLVLPLPAGAVIDRWNRRRVMIWCDALRGLAIGSIVAALALHQLTVGQILGVGVLEGSLSVVFKIAASAAVPNVVEKSQLTLAFSRSEARARGAAMVGQPLGGLLFGIGRAVPFLFDALTYVVSFTSLLLIRKEFQTERKPADGPAWRRFAAGVEWLWGQPFLRTSTFVIAGSNLLFQALFLAIIVIAKQDGASSSAVGVIFGVAATGGVIGSLAAPAIKRRFSMKAVVIGANWAWALLVPTVVLVHQSYLLGVVYALMCFVGPIWNVAITAYQLDITPDHIQGRVLGAAGMIAFGGVPLGSLLGGILLGSLSAAHTVWVLAGWMLLLAVVATISPSIRHAPTPTPATPPEPEPATTA
jgi:MFS family permease